MLPKAQKKSQNVFSKKKKKDENLSRNYNYFSVLLFRNLSIFEHISMKHQSDWVNDNQPTNWSFFCLSSHEIIMQDEAEIWIAQCAASQCCLRAFRIAFAVIWIPHLPTLCSRFDWATLSLPT